MKISPFLILSLCCVQILFAEETRPPAEPTKETPKETTIPPAEEKETLAKFKELASQPGAVSFQPPPGWVLGDKKNMKPCVQVVVVGKSKTDFTPSLSLIVEDFAGTLKQYLRIVQLKSQNYGDDWKDLGRIQTEAGEASLSQADVKSKWGTERRMYVILLNKGKIYILTGGALKDDFSNHYKDFFNAFRSLRINPSS